MERASESNPADDPEPAEPEALAPEGLLRQARPHVEDPRLPGAWDRLARALFDDEPAPATVGRYALGDEIGVGGMGRVVMAHDPTLDRTVALKLVRTDLLDRATQKRLAREARAMARINHPNVVPVYDVGRHHELVYVAMEHVRGTTLAAWLRGPERTSWRERLAVVCAAGRGLHAAHAVGIVHRDFKPANVLVGDDGRVMVTDFGLARLRAGVVAGEPDPVGPGLPTERSSVLTQPGMVMGTPAYMAPEQYAGLDADARADQFALCVTLWEALWGERPYHGSLTQVAAAKVAGPPPCPRGGEVPRAIARVLRRGLHPTPDQRWPTVERLLAALEAAASRRFGWRAWVAVAVGLGVAGAIAWVLGRAW